MKKYAVVIERGENNLSAYVPDLPGCITTGQTVEEIEHNVLKKYSPTGIAGLFQRIFTARRRPHADDKGPMLGTGASTTVAGANAGGTP